MLLPPLPTSWWLEILGLVQGRSTQAQRELPRKVLGKHAPHKRGKFQAYPPNKVSQVTMFFPTIMLQQTIYTFFLLT